MSEVRLLKTQIASVVAGDTLSSGKYRVERVLGRGAMGLVVAATHVELDEPCAIKFMLETTLEPSEAFERFRREARASARLKGEHVARVHDFGRLEDKTPFLVMEFLEGKNLDEVLTACGPLRPEEAALYALQACEALAEAHAAGIVHRDVKPANLFLCRRPDGSSTIKLLDFGISKGAIGAAQDSGGVTTTNAMLGSPAYMAPEQMRSARSADARSDVWSLGVTLYKLRTGRLPFPGDSVTAVMLAAQELPPRPDPALGELEPIILRCLQKDPARRPASVVELGAALVPLARAEGAAYGERIRRIAGRAVAPMDEPSDAGAGAVAGAESWGSTLVDRRGGWATRRLIHGAIVVSAVAVASAFTATVMHWRGGGGAAANAASAPSNAPSEAAARPPPLSAAPLVAPPESMPSTVDGPAAATATSAPTAAPRASTAPPRGAAPHAASTARQGDPFGHSRK